MKNVQALLNKEAKAREILANIGAEKETLAINKLTEVKEILAVLDCSYLLETSIPSPMAPVTNVTISKGKIVKVVEKVEVVKAPVTNVTIQKGKVVKIEKEVEIERIVVDTKEIEKHLETISNKDKEIQALKKSVSTWQSKATKLEEKIAELEAQLEAKKKSPKERAMEALDSVSDLELEDTEMNSKEYLEMLANQEESCTHVSEEIVAPVAPVEEKQQPVNVLANSPQFVKLTKINAGLNDKAKMYQTEKCYMIASPTTDEITWISNETLSDEYKIAVERKLVKDYNFGTSRTKLSPVTVTTKNGYMARCKAVDGYDNFSPRDMVAGYVKLSNKFYLYTYQLGFNKPFIKEFDLMIKGSDHTYPTDKTCVTTITSMIWNMVDSYKKQVNKLEKERKEQAKANANIVKDKLDAREEKIKANEAILKASGIEVKKKGVLKPNVAVNSNVSNDNVKKTCSIIDDTLDEMF